MKVDASEEIIATSLSVRCIFLPSDNPTALAHDSNPPGVFKIDTMSSEIYMRKSRNFSQELTENDETFTLNTVHLQNPYKVTQRFEGFNGSRLNALKLQPNSFPKVMILIVIK